MLQTLDFWDQTEGEKWGEIGYLLTADLMGWPCSIDGESARVWASRGIHGIDSKSYQWVKPSAQVLSRDTIDSWIYDRCVKKKIFCINFFKLVCGYCERVKEIKRDGKNVRRWHYPYIVSPERERERWLKEMRQQ